MKTTQVWKVEGESSDGDYLDGDEFQIEEQANYARRMLEMEFPENVYWVDSYERMTDEDLEMSMKKMDNACIVKYDSRKFIEEWN